MTDITPQEAAWFNEDCAIVEARIRDRLLVSPLWDMDIITSAIVRQLWLRWFGFDYSMENIEKIRALRNLLGIGPGNDSLGSLPPHA
jgi:hypothetical protein